MKKLSLLLAVLMLFALFSACGDKADTSATPTPASTSVGSNEAKPTPTDTTPAASEPTATDPGTETSRIPGQVKLDDGTYYNFAAGAVEKDADGMPLSKFEYELPLTNSNEALTLWTSCFTPEYIEGDYPDSPFPVQLEEKTGINIEYLIVSMAARAENFSVMLAADDLPDILAGVESYFPGSFIESFNDDPYFVNLYDYRDYMPNYLYEVLESSDDTTLQETVFVNDGLITSMRSMRDKIYIQNALFVRSDWLDIIGWTRDDIVTWEDTYDLLYAFKSQLETDSPTVLFKYLFSDHWACFDTLAYLNPYSLDCRIDDEGKTWLAQTTERDYNLASELNRFIEAGFFQRDWQSWSSMNDERWRGMWLDDTFGYVPLATPDLVTEKGILDTPESEWMPLPDPVLYEGQVLHVGADLTRLYYGSIVFNIKCENIELAITAMDWRYSNDGAYFGSMGAKGTFWDYNEQGEPEILEAMYTDPNRNFNMLLAVYCNNVFLEAGMDISELHFLFPGGDEVIEAYNYLRSTRNLDNAYVLPAGVNLSGDQANIVYRYSNDVKTYLDENYLLFVDGSKPLDEWDSYVSVLDEIGVPEILGAYQEAYDDYLARKG